MPYASKEAVRMTCSSPSHGMGGDPSMEDKTQSEESARIATGNQNYGKYYGELLNS